MEKILTALDTLKIAKLIFWDFDGVIKESVAVKTKAFVQLFQPFGSSVVEQVRAHHEMNGGMSRFDKLPIYLGWAGFESTKVRVDEFSKQFSKLVFQSVIVSPWVPGVEDYLRGNPRKQIFVLVSATPQQELEEILRVLGLLNCFVAVFGAPITKNDAIQSILTLKKIEPAHALMIGDSRADMEAAHANKVPFLLRRNEFNDILFTKYQGPFFKDFTEL